MRILVTNDDGVHAPGLRALANAMCELAGDHEIVVVAPDSEYSGAGASLGALHEIRPVVREATIPDCPASAIWSVSGPPALCVMFARLGAFGAPFDLIVAGINPGANVGRAVYHSGTVGAALTARNGRISGVAVSRAVSGYGVEGQAWDEAIAGISWDSAARVGKVVVQALLDDLPAEPVVVNINVPDVAMDEIKGWRYTAVGHVPPRTVAEAALVPIHGEDGAFRVEMGWGDKVELDEWTDGGAVEAGYVAVTYLSRLGHEDRDDVAAAGKALDELLRS
ncbi:MAG: 5'/3'-nucleotidase SurE [Ilumatobacter sp.]|nr:5'/3'-nucleotidase SurE [Ilumatobacter sp.]